MKPEKYTSLGITAACFWAIYGILGCGGGVPNSGTENPNVGISNPVYHWCDYVPCRESTTRTFSGGTYSTVVKGNEIAFRWGKTIENFRVVGSWICLDSFLDDGQKAPYFIRTTKAEMSIDGGVWEAVVHPCDGHPYSPVTFDKPYALRVWGYVDHIPFFWQHSITPQTSIRNTCWTSDGNTRDVLHQQEVWHDAVRGWEPTRGTGTLKDGIPDGTGIVYTWFQTIAKNAGPLWTSTNYCLVR